MFYNVLTLEVLASSETLFWTGAKGRIPVTLRSRVTVRAFHEFAYSIFVSVYSVISNMTGYSIRVIRQDPFNAVHLKEMY